MPENNGQIMTVNKPIPLHNGPWANQGTVLQEAPTSAEAMRLAGLDWEVATRPAGYIGPDGDFIENPNKKMVVRLSDGKPLSVVGNKWEPMQNTDAFSFFDPMVEAGLCEYNVAGYVNDGEKVFVMAKIKADPMEVVANDTVDSYLILTNLHSAAASGRIIFTNIRFICTNVLPAIMREAKQTKIMHIGNVLKNIQQVREIVDMRRQDFSSTLEQFKALAAASVKNSDDLDRYVHRVLSNDKIKIVNGKAETEKDERGYKQTKTKIIELFEGGVGTDIPGVKGTWWGAYNAMTEYYGYHKGRELNNRLDSVFYGDAKKKSERALETALDMAMAA